MGVLTVISKIHGAHVILYDDEDVDFILSHTWSLSKKDIGLYAHRKCRGKTLYLSRELLGVDDPKLLVDHKNHNTLDNRKENLRVCNKRKNSENQSPQRRETSSLYKGVNFFKRVKRWRAYIKVNQKQIHLGYYLTEIEAAQAYDNAAKTYFGEFCHLNFPEDK